MARLMYCTNLDCREPHPVVKPAPQPCPHCGKPTGWSSTQLVAPSEVDWLPIDRVILHLLRISPGSAQD